MESMPAFPERIALYDNRFHVVVQDLFGNTLEITKGILMARFERVELFIGHKLDIRVAAPSQPGHKGG